jgi:hypothetical protein
MLPISIFFYFFLFFFTISIKKGTPEVILKSLVRFKKPVCLAAKIDFECDLIRDLNQKLKL